MSKRKTVLIISYYFAPSAAVGAKRFSFLAREFQRLGYRVQVVAGELRETPAAAETDPSLPAHGSIHRCGEALHLPLPGKGVRARAGNALWRNVLSAVGLEFFWTRRAIRQALAIADRRDTGVVIATSPPPAAAIAGAYVARRLGWPLILDYRDPWSAYPWPSWRRGPFGQWLARRIEAHCLRRSAARVLNTPAMRDWFERYFPAVARDRNYVIPNGFDAVAPPASRVPPREALQIVHAGAIYVGRSLLPILQAVANLAQRYPARSIRVVSYGGLPPGERARIDSAGLQSFLDVRDRVPRTELFEHLQAADVLLALVSSHMAYSAPYKIYDYLAAGRPILALAPSGSALHGFMAECGAGRCVDPQDAAGVERALEMLLFQSAPRTARVDRYLWCNLALQYREVIETAMQEGSSQEKFAEQAIEPR